MPVLFQTHVRSVQFRRERVKGLAQAMLAYVGSSAAELSVTFIGDRRMRRLNRHFRRKDRTTDVLAFAMREAAAPRWVRRSRCLLGDVVISVPTAMRQAKEGRRTLDHELVVLMIHGILHLCGYDHERSDVEARRMQQKEIAVLRSLMPLPKLVRRSADVPHMTHHR